jgi:hypothetical protein
MTELHPNNGRQIITELLSKSHRVIEVSERRPLVRESESAPRHEESIHLNLKMVAIRVFVVFNIAALLFAVYVIWAKCCGDSPF